MVCAMKDLQGLALPAKTVIYGMAVCIEHLPIAVEFQGDLVSIAHQLNPDMAETNFSSFGKIEH